MGDPRSTLFTMARPTLSVAGLFFMPPGRRGQAEGHFGASKECISNKTLTILDCAHATLSFNHLSSADVNILKQRRGMCPREKFASKESAQTRGGGRGIVGL